MTFHAVRTRYTSILTTLALLIVIALGGSVLAQETPDRFCGDLSAEDCALLEQADANMAALSSANFGLTMDFSAQAVDLDNMAFSLTVDGSYSVDQAMMPEMDPEAMTEGEMPDITALLEQVGQAIGAISADVTVTVNLPEEAAASGMPSDLMIESRLVDGTGYINLTPFSEMAAEIPAGWHGTNVPELLNTLREMFGPMLSMGQAGGTDPFSSAMNFQNLSDEFTPEQLASFLSVERLADTEINGQSTAAFTTDVDLGAFYSDETFQEMLREQLRAQMEMGGAQLDDAEIQQALDQQMQLLQNMTFTITEYVGLQDNYTHQVDVSMLIPESTMEGETIPEISMNLSLTQSDFNNVPAIEAPADATVYTTEELLQGFGMMPQQ